MTGALSRRPSRRRLAWLALVAVLIAAAWAAAAAPGPRDALAADPCPAAPSGDGVTFHAVGDFQLRVPAGVDRVSVDVRGGHGGHEPSTAEGGQGGLASATIAVTAGECLDVVVGEYGYGAGGFGLGSGGRHGLQGSPAAYDGAGGGGASALLRGGTPLVVGGGGGGGGGQGEFSEYAGGRGGDGASGAGAGTPDGGDGYSAPMSPEFLGGDGGAAGDGDHQGGDGTDVDGPYPFIGAGGGGGGGAQGGSGGAHYVVEGGGQDFLRMYGGGGGGGGSSYAEPGAADALFTVAGVSCPVNGGPAECHGEVSLSWIQTPAHVAPYGGSDQSTVITTGFPRPLQARVTAASGDPVPGVTVTFTLPAGGPGAWFDTASRPTTATATTDADGLASSPPLVADENGGAWTATATVPIAQVPPARFALVNDPATTATALYASASPSVTGEPVRFSAVVGASPSSSGVPAGHVEFRVAGVQVGQPAALDSAGVAISDPVPLGIGVHEVTAVYAGDADDRASAAAIEQAVQRAPTATTLSSSRNPAPDGAPVTFETEVAPVAPGSGTPTGTVRFELDEQLVGTATLSAGRASITPPAAALGTGSHVMVATYAGDAGFVASGASLGQTVGTGVTVTEISSSQRPSAFGEALTFTATVRSDAAGTPTGAIDFRVDGDELCAGVSLDAAGAAECTPPAPLPAGGHDVTASYSGDQTFSPSEGSAVQPIERARTVVGVEAAPGPAVFGQPVMLHADVSAQPPGAGTPTGSVRFRIDGAPVGGPVALTADGATAPAPAPLGAGPHVIEAEYLGDGDFLAGRRAAVTVVDRALSTATMSASANPAPFGAPITFRVELGIVAPGTGDGGGTVRFRVDGVTRGAAVPVRHGVAVSAPVDGLAPGVHEVRGSYSGDDDVAPGEATLSLPVIASSGPSPRPAPASVAVSSSPNPSRDTEVVALSATIAPAAPAGSVAFSADGAPLAGCEAVGTSDAVAVCRISGLAPGTHVLAAAYRGSSDQVEQVVEGTSSASDLVPPSGEPAEPATSCEPPIVLTDVGVAGGRVRIAGVARAAYAGRRVTIDQAGRRIARATIRPDGRFGAVAPRPAGDGWRERLVRAEVAGHRSAAVKLKRRLHVTGRTALAGGRVRVRARIAGGGRPRVALERLPDCSTAAPRRIETVRADRHGRLGVTLPGPGRYRLRVAGSNTHSLPIVVIGAGPTTKEHP